MVDIVFLCVVSFLSTADLAQAIESQPHIVSMRAYGASTVLHSL